MNKGQSLDTIFYTKKSLDMAYDKANLLGNKVKPVTLLRTRLILTVVIFITLLFLKYGYFIAPITAFLFYELFFPVFVNSKIEQRGRILERDSLYFFEILALSLEAGRSIKTSIEITCNNIDSELSKEFKKLINDVNFGKDLSTALEEMKYRIPSDTINNIILSIRQSNIFGNNIIDTVYSQIAYIREKQILETKAYISKMPIKISIISVVFFVPLLLLLLLGPLIISLLG